MDPRWPDPAISRELGDIPLPPLPPPPPPLLGDYLLHLDDGAKQPPENLVLPAEMVAAFDKLYRSAERAAAEQGFALLLDRRTGTFSAGKLIKGNTNSIDPFKMPEIKYQDCFGYVHAHPSASIGHVGGYSPHSIQDLLMFEDWSARPYFFEFVVSGPRLFAMIFIRGVSAWNDEVKRHLGKRLGVAQNKEKELIYEAAGGREAWESGNLELSDEADAAKYRLRVIAKLPGFGRRMAEIAMTECQSFAKKFNYAFVVWG